MCIIVFRMGLIIQLIKEPDGFDEISILPGESKRVDFKIGKNYLGFYNDLGEYSPERGESEIFGGNSCLIDNKGEISIN